MGNSATGTVTITVLDLMSGINCASASSEGSAGLSDVALLLLLVAFLCRPSRPRQFLRGQA